MVSSSVGTSVRSPRLWYTFTITTLLTLTYRAIWLFTRRICLTRRPGFLLTYVITLGFKSAQLSFRT